MCAFLHFEIHSWLRVLLKIRLLFLHSAGWLKLRLQWQNFGNVFSPWTDTGGPFWPHCNLSSRLLGVHVCARVVQHHRLCAVTGQHGILMSSIKVFMYPKAKKKNLRNFLLTLLSAAKTEGKYKYWSPVLTLQATLLLCLASSFFHDYGDVAQGQTHGSPVPTHCSGSRSNFFMQPLPVNTKPF